MVNGDVCPADPNQMIDFVSCKDVGVSDGLQNLLFLGYWTIGSDFVMFAVNIAGTCIGMLWPGMENYLRETLDGFISASDTQQKRQRFCFYATLPTILFPLLVIFLVGMTLGLVVPALVDFIRSMVDVFFATPAAEAIPGAGGQEWFNVPMDEGYGNVKQLTPDYYYTEPPMNIVESSIGQPMFIQRAAIAAAYHLNHLVWPSLWEKKKQKKE